VSNTPPSPPNKNDKNQKDPSGTGSKLEVLLEELKRRGVTTARARDMLKKWQEVGVDDPEKLRKLLIQRSLRPASGILFQMLLDAIASFGGFWVGYLASEGEDFPFRILLEIAGYFFGLYYFVQVLLQLTLASAVLYSAYRYGTSSNELLSAVRTLAGPMSGVTVLDRANEAVNTLKVISTLEAMASLLQEQYGGEQAAANASSLRNLSAYLTLARAKEQLGFNPEAYNLTEKQASNIALAFSTYDTNDNGKLEKAELANLCATLDWNLSEAELREAYRTLDANQSGYIEFNEFVDWFTGKCPTINKPTTN